MSQFPGNLVRKEHLWYWMPVLAELNYRGYFTTDEWEQIVKASPDKI